MVQRVFRQFAWQAAKLSRIEGSGWCITSVSKDCTSVSLPTGARTYVPELWIELKKGPVVDLFLEVIDVLEEGKVFGAALEHADVGRQVERDEQEDHPLRYQAEGLRRAIGRDGSEDCDERAEGEPSRVIYAEEEE